MAESGGLHVRSCPWPVAARLFATEAVPPGSPAQNVLLPSVPVVVRPGLAPDQSLYDAADPELRAAAALLQDALAAPNVVREEELWTQIIQR